MNDETHQRNLIILRSELLEISQRERSGTISYKAFSKTKNRIVGAVIDITQNLKEKNSKLMFAT